MLKITKINDGSKLCEKVSLWKIAYGEFPSNYKETDEISYCFLSRTNSNESIDEVRKGIFNVFFIPEIGVKLPKLLSLFERIVKNRCKFNFYI